MATEIDEAMLRRIWNREALGRYEGKWIAFREVILASDADLSVLSERFRDQMREGNGPLFAYVTFESRV